MNMVGDDVPRSILEARNSSFLMDSKARDRRGPTCPVNARLAEEVKELVEWHAENRRRKRSERIPRRPAAVAAEQVRLRSVQSELASSSSSAPGSINAVRVKEFKGDVDNIFDDVDGSFSTEAVVQAAASGQQLAKMKQGSSYFDDAGAHAGGAEIARIFDDGNDEGINRKNKSFGRTEGDASVAKRISELEEVDEADLQSRLARVFDDEENKEAKKAKRVNDLLSDGNDPYFECYPPNVDSILREEMNDEHDDIFTKLRRGMIDETTELPAANGVKRKRGRGKPGENDADREKDDKPKLSSEAKANREWKLLKKTLDERKTKGQGLSAIQATSSYKVTNYRPTVK